MKRMKTIWFVFVGIMVIAISACGGSEKKEKAEISNPKSVDPVEKARMYFKANMSKMSDLSKNDTLTFNLSNSDEKFQLMIRKIEETMPGILSISADVENKGTGLAFLLYRDGGISGFIDMYGSNQRFQIMYDQEPDAYYLNEIKPEDRDELEGGIPLTPPSEEY